MNNSRAGTLLSDGSNMNRAVINDNVQAPWKTLAGHRVQPSFLHDCAISPTAPKTGPTFA